MTSQTLERRRAVARVWRGEAMRVALASGALLVLLAPALWNGYPLLQYDTGGYLARWYESYLVPSRSTVFGLFLHVGEGMSFWPEVAVQSVLTLWIIALVLRVFGLAGRPRLPATVAALAILTALPWLTSILLTDIFAGLGVLAFYLLVLRADDLRRWERIALFVLTAFSAATHSATFVVLFALLAAAVLAAGRALVPLGGLMRGAGALACGAAMLLAANFALSGRLAWTPGGYGIAFGRMLQDGIVSRYLDDHCPNPNLRLCPYRKELPASADEFLWGYGVFNDLGRFAGLGEEMRKIVLASLVEYPGQQAASALAAMLKQLTLVASGEGVHDGIMHTYGIMERFIPAEVPAMRAARQQRGELDIGALNRLQVPIALLSMLLTFVLAATLPRRREDLAMLAATVALAVLANAFVCGAVSGPHDRYGARLAWVATFVVIVALLRAAGLVHRESAALAP